MNLPAINFTSNKTRAVLIIGSVAGAVTLYLGGVACVRSWKRKQQANAAAAAELTELEEMAANRHDTVFDKKKTPDIIIEDAAASEVVKSDAELLQQLRDIEVGNIAPVSSTVLRHRSQMASADDSKGIVPAILRMAGAAEDEVAIARTRRERATARDDATGKALMQSIITPNGPQLSVPASTLPESMDMIEVPIDVNDPSKGVTSVLRHTVVVGAGDVTPLRGNMLVPRQPVVEVEQPVVEVMASPVGNDIPVVAPSNTPDPVSAAKVAEFEQEAVIAFEHIHKSLADAGKVMDFNEAWSDGTDYYSNAVGFGAASVQLKPGVQAATTDHAGRKLIFTGTPLGTMLTFQRYSNVKEGVYVNLASSDLENSGFLPMNNVLSAAEINDLLVDRGDGLGNLGERLQNAKNRMAKRLHNR